MSASLTITDHPTLNGITLPATSGAGGAIKGTVTIAGAAPVGGLVVTLTSDTPAKASVPATVTIPVNASSVDFMVSTTAVAASTPIVISAVFDGVTKSASMTLVPLALVDLSVVLSGAHSMAGGWTMTPNSVDINGPAPVGGIGVNLSSSSSAVSVPSSIQVPEGAVSAQFELTTWSVCTSTTAVITASLGGVTKTGSFTVVPTEPRSITLTPSTVASGDTASALVALTGDAYGINCPVVLASSDTSRATLPTRVGSCTSHSDMWELAEYQCTVSVSTPLTAPAGTVTISATGPTQTKTATLTVQPGTQVTGIAPGTALPGDTIAVYGPIFAPQASVIVSGPVYTLTGTTHALCDLAAGQCPSQGVPAVVNFDRTAVSFVLPSGLAPGGYSLQVRDDPRVISKGTWFAVGAPSVTYPAVTPANHQMATQILPGQTVTGTLTGDTPAPGLSDFNFYYFFGTAGSTINVSLDRVDASIPWEHPDSLDPQIEVIAPDGFIYQNLVAHDNQPSVDLNASLHNAVLPETGMYILAAETTRGHGDYRLALSFSSRAVEANQSKLIIPIDGNYVTVHPGTELQTSAAFLDPRGQPLSGAAVRYVTASAPEDHGFALLNPWYDPGIDRTTSSDGFVVKLVQVMGMGKAQFSPTLLAGFASSLAPANAAPNVSTEVDGTGRSASTASVTGDAVAAAPPIPRYQPTGRVSMTTRGLTADRHLRLAISGFERLAIERRQRRHTERTGSSGATQSRDATTTSASRSSGRFSATVAPAQAATASHPTETIDPADASTAVPLPEPQHGMQASVQAITSCSSGVYSVARSPALAPFSVTFTDLTPPPGGSFGNGVVGVDGIHGHRIGTILRLKIDIKDSLGHDPGAPVLIHMAIGGDRHGTIILDPDGARIECPDAAFLWHDADAQGYFTLNDQIELRLGTLATLVGYEADPAHPGQVRPIWGAPEELAINLPLAGTGYQSVPIHPEPGQPDHLQCIENGAQCPDLFEYWNGYLVDVLSLPLASVPMKIWDAYFLTDRYNNTVYGCTNTSATQPGSGVTVGFTDQTAGDTGGDFAGYTLATTWQMSPPPSGRLGSTLSVTYPADPDNAWGSGTVTKDITYQFDGGSTHLLVQTQSYEKRLADQGLTVLDGDMPMTVAPAASGSLGTLPDHSTPRLVLLALSGSYVTSTITGWGVEPSPTLGYGWQKGAGCQATANWCYVQWLPAWDLKLETQDTPQFRLKLVDGAGRVATDGSFVVHTCPRAEHLTDPAPLPPPCTDMQVATPDGTGTVQLTLNQTGSARGYMGIELTKAPVAPGIYYVIVESLDKTYRIRRESQLAGTTADDEYRGGFAICIVTGGKLLDENFNPVVNTLNIAINRGVYAQEIDLNQTADSYQADIVFQDVYTPEETSLNNVTYWRVGKSAVFQTGLITVISPDPPPSEAARVWNEAVTEQTMASMQGASPAGSITPTSGLRRILERRAAGTGVAPVQLQMAATRIATIESATPNFDGVTTGEGLAARDHIEATVTWGEQGWISVRMFNVDNPAVFTFDFWGQDNVPLTTDLRANGGLPVDAAVGGDGAQYNTKEAQATFPAGGVGFKAEVPTGGSNRTLNPGLYLLRAKWAPNRGSATSTIRSPVCVTDKPSPDVCDNEWVISVGQRIFLDADQEALNTLGTVLATVQDPDPPSTRRTSQQFLTDVAVAATGVYSAAGANVVVSTDPSLLRPFMRHAVQSTLPLTTDCGTGWVMYGCTSLSAAFPLMKPDLDLAPTASFGISIGQVYGGMAPGLDKDRQRAWVEHLPLQPRNGTADLWGPGNPSPSTVFFTRLVNVVVHETAHGFGLVSASPYRRHGTPTTPAQLNDVVATWNYSIADGIVYTESPSRLDEDHEVFLRVGAETKGIYKNEWIMQAAPFHWNGAFPEYCTEYDTPTTPADPTRPVWWLTFDRPMRFSTRADWTDYGENVPDHSRETFFSERVPLCQHAAPVRSCR